MAISCLAKASPHRFAPPAWVPPPAVLQVARLRERLEAFGVDVDALLADIVAAGEAGEEDLL